MFVMKKYLSVFLSVSVVFGVVFSTPVAAASDKKSRAVAASGNSSDTKISVSNWVSEPSLDGSLQPESFVVTVDGKPHLLNNGAFELSEGSEVKFNILVKESGKYEIALKYSPVNSLYTDCLFDLKCDNETYVTSLPVLWADATVNYGTDRLGNQLIPEQKAVTDFFTDFMRNYRDTDSGRLVLDLDSGMKQISISPQAQSVKIEKIYLKKISENKSYSEYASENGKYSKYEKMLSFEAERYSVKSDSFIRAASEKNAALKPYNTYRKMLNVVDDGSWSSLGQKIIWEFDIPQDGLYGIAVRCRQNSDTNKPVFRKIEIDGVVPFAEWEAFSFENTKTGKYTNKVLTAGNEITYLYFTKGTHTIAMTATLGPLKQVYDEIVTLMDDINALGMDIQKITAGQTDSNRTWNMEYYLPNAVDDLNKFADRIDGIYSELEKIGGKKPSFANSLKYASETLRKLVKTPNQIPNKTDLINQGDSSATKYLGNVLEALVRTPLSFDAFYIGNTSEIPPAETSIFKKASEWVKAFLWSFTADASSGDYTTTKPGKNNELTVWVNRSVQYVQTLQQLIDAEYNSKYGTNIQLSIMPSEQKLILSNATGTNPDVVLGAGLSTPFNLAIRGAAKNLLEYDDFLTFYNENYNLQTLIPTTYGDGVYGAVESQDFYVLFYRKDILDTLGLSVPDTWDDVKTMMPSLLRYGMNFFIPISSGAAYKGFTLTSPFVYQNGAAYVSNNGTESLFDTENFIDAMTEMTEIYKIYGMSSSVPSFYNSFRSGEIPIGISTFATYMQLQMAAPELAGKWGIALAPGTVQDDGSVVRYQPAATNACMIFENTKKSDEAWRFLKWWLETDTQVKYAYMLQSRYGTEYRWNSANLNAFSQMSYSADDRSIILSQWKDQRETVNHPANYMIERESSDIWNGVVVDNESLIEEIDRATSLTNREIKRKLIEFGFCDKDGNVIKDYSMTAYKTLVNKLNETKKGETE